MPAPYVAFVFGDPKISPAEADRASGLIGVTIAAGVVVEPVQIAFLSSGSSGAD